MSVEVWGLMNKSSIDPEKIEEAIDRIVQAHDDDPTAHLDDGQSLTSHRASEIIDHRAESIVNDKLKLNIRRYVAIVDVDSPADFDNIPDAVAYADEQGGGTVFIKRGYYELFEDLILPRAVDLEGEGIDETFISFQGFDRQILTYKTFYLSENEYADVQVTNGSPVITLNSYNWDQGHVVAGFVIKLYGSNETKEYTIASIDSPTQATLTENYTDITEVVSGYTNLKMTFTNGDNRIVAPTNIDLYSLGFRVGQKIKATNGSSNYYIITGISDNIITVLETISEPASGDYYVLVSEINAPSNIIKELTLAYSSADYVISATSQRVPPTLESVKFYSCVNTIESTYTYNYYTMKDCVIENCTGSALISVLNYYISNLDCETVDDDVVCFSHLASSYLYRCHVKLNDSNNTSIFDVIETNNVIDSCDFEHAKNFDIGSESNFYIRMINNIITLSNDSDIEFKHYESQIIGNRLSTSGSGRFILTSSSNKNIVIANVTDFSITDNGTNNEVSLNVVS